MKLVLVAAIALINDEGQVLVAERPAGKSMAGLWEFPGGKVEDGESPEACLARECREELGIDIDVSALLPLTFASHAYDTFHLMMPVWRCSRWAGTPTGCEGQKLRWVGAAELQGLPMPPADVPLLAPIIQAMAD